MIASTQEIFERLVELVGHNVEVGVLGSEQPLRGTVTNTMFDSFIVTQSGKPHIVRFEDIQYLQERS